MIINQSDYFKNNYSIEITSGERNSQKIETRVTESKSSRTKLKAIMREGKRLNIKSSCSISGSTRKSSSNGIEKNRKIEKSWPTKLRLTMTSRRNRSR